MFECVCCYVICFGIVCVIFSQLLWFFLYLFRLIFKWCLFGSDSCSISSASCFRDYFPFFVCSYKNLLQIPCRNQEKRKFTIFLLACLPFLSQPFGAVCVSSFPISISTFARRLSVFYHSSFFQLKSGSKTDLCLYDFVCLHIFFVFFYVGVSDVSKGRETQNKNSVCCHFKLDLESKLKNSTALSAHKLKTRPTTTLIRLISVRAFLGGGGAILVLHAVGVIESSSWPTVFCLFVSPPQIKPLKFLQKGEDFTMFYIVSSVSLFCLLILSLYH